MFPNIFSKQFSSIYFLLGTSTDFFVLQTEDRRWEKIKNQRQREIRQKFNAYISMKKILNLIHSTEAERK